MSKIYKGTLGLIGNTPLVEVVNIEKELGLEATLLVKLDSLPPQSRNMFTGDKEQIQSLRNQAADYEKQAKEWMMPHEL